MQLKSDLTIFEVAEWKLVLLEELHKGEVSLDLAQAGKIDASGMQLLMLAHRTGKFHLHNIPATSAEDLKRLGWEPGKQS